MSEPRSRTARRAAGVLLLATLVTATGGCGVVRRIFGGPPIPPRELYRLALPGDPADTAASDGAARPLDGTLAIAQYVAPGVYGDAGIVYRIDDTQYGAYPNREWAMPLAEQLGALTERVLGRQPLTSQRAVFDPPSQRSQTYIWRGTIRQFEEVDRGTQVMAAVGLDVRIVRAADDSIVWSGSTHIERPASASNMTGIVQTLSELATQAVTELAGRAKTELLNRRP